MWEVDEPVAGFVVQNMLRNYIYKKCFVCGVLLGWRDNGLLGRELRTTHMETHTNRSPTSLVTKVRRALSTCVPFIEHIQRTTLHPGPLNYSQRARKICHSNPGCSVGLPRSGKKPLFSRSGKSQGILNQVREILNQ